MKKLLFLAFCLLTGTVSEQRGGYAILSPTPTACAHGSFAYCESIVVDHTKIGSSDLAVGDFAVPVPDTTNTETTGNGGFATSSSGYDVEIFSAPGCTGTKMNWARPFYDPAGTSGYVYLAPTVIISHTTNTLVGYRCIGNASVTTDQSNPTAVFSSAYLSVYPFSNGTTLSASDVTGNHNGTITGATAGVGQLDGAANIGTGTPVNDFIIASTSPIIGASTTWTIEAWVKATVCSGSSGQSVYSERGATGNDILKLDSCSSFQPSTASIFITYRDDGGTLFQGAYTGSLSTGIYYHVVATFGANTFKTYLNGAFMSSGTWTGTNNFTGTRSSYIGGDLGDATASWNGLIDEVKLQNVTRSADWVTAAYNSESNIGSFTILTTL